MAATCSCRSSAAASRSSPTSYSDPEKGTGAVKITPAHDFNDFEVGRRHALEAIAILDELGRVNANAPEAYRGLDRFEARRRVVAELEALGLLDRVEKHRHTVPHGDRSGTPLEPFLTDQWYCDAKTLAQAAIAAVEDGRTRFVPRLWENTYFEWMRNIQPWCISRQLWWGHQIPAWYGPDGRVFVEESEAEAAAAALAHYGHAVPLRRDEDVLDTWFSSGLWPFSTLGWPEQTPELARFYPTSVLVTGFDIIFFWVARMMMLGLHFTGEVPFKDVYIHGLVRDERGTKMSKTKGNVVDPLQVIDDYGADALRLALLASTAQGPRRQVRPRPGRGLPQLRHQALERRPLRPDERGVAAARLRPRSLPRAAQPLDRRRDPEDRRRRHRRARSLSLQRRGPGPLPFPLGHLLRLVCRARQAPAPRRGRCRPGGDARHRRLGPGAGPAPAAPHRPLRHRGAVAAAVRPPWRHADRRRLAAPRRRAARCPRGSRTRLAGPPDRRHPHRPQRAERSARHPAHPAPARRRAHDSRLAGAPQRRDPADGARRRDHPRRPADSAAVAGGGDRRGDLRPARRSTSSTLLPSAPASSARSASSPPKSNAAGRSWTMPTSCRGPRPR